MAFLLFFAAFLYYLGGLPGTVPSYRDSGDLISAIHTLGIAHPPGYALYVLIGKLFVTLVPFGNIAYRINVMSAFFAAMTVALLFKLTQRVFNAVEYWNGLVVVALFASSPAVVSLARVAEMYSLSAFLAVAILYLLMSDHPRGASIAALLLGLGLSVHPTLIFLAPLFVAKWGSKEVKGSALLFFCLGLTVFLYLPIRAAQHPLVNWGDPSHWRNFWRVVTRADYGGLKLHPEQSVFSWTPQSILIQLRFFMGALKNEWGWGALILGSAGIGLSLHNQKTRGSGILLLLSWLLAGPGLFLLSNLPLQEATTPAILQPYLLLTSVLWAPFVVVGLQAGSRHKIAQGALILVMLATRSWTFPSQRNDYFAYDYARNLLRSLPSQAVLYDPDDPTQFTLQALQTVENRRTDIILLSFFRTRWGYEQIKRRWPELLPPIPIDNGQELQKILWSYSVRQRPFYAELPQKFGQVPYHAQGLVYRAETGPDADSGVRSRQRAEALLDLYVMRGDFVTDHHPDFFTRHMISYYSAAQNNLGVEYANLGEWERAIGHYRSALQMEPDQAAAQKNLARALSRT